LAKLQQVKHGAFLGHSVVAEAAVIHLGQKRCHPKHPKHGYNFVNSWLICKILSMLQRALNFQ